MQTQCYTQRRMVSTRSSQTKIDSFVPDSRTPSETKKRPKASNQKSNAAASEEPKPKKVKKESSAKASKVEDADTPVVTLKKSDDTDQHLEPIKINRAPVLDLFASCSAHFEHPDLSWSTCLSLGSAVASICAISKGRAIGEIPEKDKDKQPSKQDDTEKVEVLGFQVPVRDGVAYVGDQKKPPNEPYLKNKFGERYEEVKDTMNEALQSWKGHEEDFKKKGFHMYEKFRPGSGQWGAKGGLEVEEVKRVIMR